MSAVMFVNVVALEVKVEKKDVKSIPCQICKHRGYGDLNYYLQMNVTKFSPTNNKAAEHQQPGRRSYVNLAYGSE